MKRILKSVSLFVIFLLLINMIIVQSAFAQPLGQQKNDNHPVKVPISLEGYPIPEINIKAASLLPLNGYFEQNVTVQNETRKVKVYIPDGTPIRSFFTVITVPEGWNTEEFLHKSGWFKIADEKQEGLYILEAGNGGWGSFDQELNYVNEAMKKITDTTYYSTMGVYYLVGYGSGGAALQGWAVNNPLFVVSQVFINADDLSAEYLKETGAKLYGTDLARYEDVPYSDIPIPTWIIDENLTSADNVINYWKNANDTVLKGKQDNKLFQSTVFVQSANSDAWPTVYSGPISKVATLEKKVNEGSYGFTKSISDFTSYYTRYDNTSVYGNGLGIRGSYDVSTIEMVEPDGREWVREYITYVPTSYTGKKAVPVVYAFGGNSQTGRVFFEATQWWQVAEKYGFILVMPSSQYSSATSATWNSANQSTATRANDFNFIKAVIEEVDETYNTDTTKRFATGQSQGSGLSQRMSFYLPEYFAAIGSTSASVSSGVADGYNGIVPVYLIMGEQDNSHYDFKVDGSPMYNTVNYWTNRNQLSGVMEWSSYMKDGRYNTYTWNNADEIPLYRYTWTEGRKHNNIHAESELLWSTWFTNWEIEEGIRYYKGKAVNTEE
jgi:hypothetical protein